MLDEVSTAATSTLAASESAQAKIEEFQKHVEGKDIFEFDSSRSPEDQACEYVKSLLRANSSHSIQMSTLNLHLGRVGFLGVTGAFFRKHFHVYIEVRDSDHSEFIHVKEKSDDGEPVEANTRLELSWNILCVKRTAEYVYIACSFHSCVLCTFFALSFVLILSI